jgi:hypothetical protein
MELWAQHEYQINKLSGAKIQTEWRIPEPEVNAFFDTGNASLDAGQLFELVFGHPWQSLVKNKPSDHQHWFQIRNRILHGSDNAPPAELRSGCAYLAGVINTLDEWGLDQPFEYGGIAPLDSLGLTDSTEVGGIPDKLIDGLGTPSKQPLVSHVHQMEWEKLLDKVKDLE